MIYTEKYAVEKKYSRGWDLMDVYESESDAIDFMERAAANEVGFRAWRVVRYMEVTVASVTKR